MESPMLKMLKSKNPDKEYPSNIGKKWNDDEEKILLEELNKNIDIELIAKTHNRSIGGINCRRREIAYKLHCTNVSIEKIIEITKLDRFQILETIKKRENNTKNCNVIKKTETTFALENEIYEMKNDIKELKNTIKELVEMMKAVYEFEDV